jgi:hypothetical protein
LYIVAEFPVQLHITEGEVALCFIHYEGSLLGRADMYSELAF